MPVLTLWDDDLPDVLLIHFEGMWTWEEALPAARQLNALCKQRSPHRVDVIANLTAPFQPGRFMDGADQLLTHAPTEPNLRLVVLAVNHLGHTLFRYFLRSRTLPFEVAFAPSVARAREVILAARSEAVVPLYIPRIGRLN